MQRLPGQKSSRVRSGRRNCAALVLFALASFGSSTHAQSRPKLYHFSHPAMATIFTLDLYCTDTDRASTVSEEVFDEIDRIEQMLSNYRESSELSRIDREAAAGPVTTDPEMMDFLTQSMHWSQVSEGAFDLTVGQLMKTWGFFRHQGTIPSAAALEQVRATTGWQKVRLDPAQRTVTFTTPGVELDPGGIGKGFAVDAAVRVLRADGIQSALLSAGGSTLYGLGAPPGKQGWRVVVEGPLPSRRTLSVMLLRDESLSSADCSRKNFVQDGHLYCHIMDPRTLRPVEGRIQVSVVDPSATASDALSNVIFVEPPDRSLRTLAAFAPRSRALIVSSGRAKPGCSRFRWNVPVDGGRCVLEPRHGAVR